MGLTPKCALAANVSLTYAHKLSNPDMVKTEPVITEHCPRKMHNNPHKQLEESGNGKLGKLMTIQYLKQWIILVLMRND
jgi:hypothetical protein